LPSQKNTDKYIKTKNQVIRVPHYVLEALLVKYQNRLINQAKNRLDIDPKLLQDVENSLSEHMRSKYGIKFNLCPLELENYILSRGVPQSNIYDDDLVGGVDLSSTGKSIGIIIWYLEKIILFNSTNTFFKKGNKKNKEQQSYSQNRRFFNSSKAANAFSVRDDGNNGSIEIPLILEKVDTLLAIKSVTTTAAISEYITPLYKPLPSTIIDELDDRQLRLPSKSAPNKCSPLLRKNLQNYISDSAGQEWQDYLAEGVGDDTNMKAKNAREASAGWQKTNIHRLSSISHHSDKEFSDTSNRLLNPYISYTSYDLPLKLMKQEQNKTKSDQKQSLSDAWDILIHDTITN
jgi:hypothetical protein